MVKPIHDTYPFLTVSQECKLLTIPGSLYELVNSENLTQIEGNVSYVRVGTTVQYTCDERFTGNNTLMTCLSSGDWFGTLIDCKGKKCPQSDNSIICEHFKFSIIFGQHFSQQSHWAMLSLCYHHYDHHGNISSIRT